MHRINAMPNADFTSTLNKLNAINKKLNTGISRKFYGNSIGINVKLEQRRFIRKISRTCLK